MKQSLQLKVGQQLTMTPQLQQAIRLLQLSTLDLQQEIQSALDSNPLLELEEETDAPAEQESNSQSKSSDTKSEANSNDNDATATEADSEWAERSDIPEDLPVDSQWDDVYQSAGTASSGPSGDDEYGNDFRHGSSDSLQDHLRWQLNLSRLSEVDQFIADAIIDAIDDKGRLTVTPEELVEAFDNDAVEIEEVQAVLHLIQQFDPPGVGGRDLQECLLIQLRQLPSDTPYLPQAIQIVEQHMDQLGSRDYNQIMRRCRLKEDQLRDALLLIQSLNPTPGDVINSGDTEYVVPDVFVSKKDGRWLVELNPDIAPKIQINSHYAALAKSSSSSEKDYIRDNLQEARWFIKSLQSRNETLMKVASKIVEYQRGFLEYGDEAMKPLVLHDIADAVGMHESTISRVTTQKYMHTPRGIYELKYFFSSHVSTDTGGECSSTAIRALIKKLIAAENPRKPLSDSKITELLAEQGIKVARRTIAKYRESLVIPPSNERKRLV